MLCGERYWTSKQCQFSCFMNLSWNFCACWNFFFLHSAMYAFCYNVLRVLWSYWIKQKIEKKIIFSLLFNNIFTTLNRTFVFRQAHTKSKKAREHIVDEKNVMQNWTCCTFKWVQWLRRSTASFIFLLHMISDVISTYK